MEIPLDSQLEKVEFCVSFSKTENENFASMKKIFQEERTRREKIHEHHFGNSVS